MDDIDVEEGQIIKKGNNLLWEAEILKQFGENLDKTVLKPFLLQMVKPAFDSYNECPSKESLDTEVIPGVKIIKLSTFFTKMQ